MNNPLPGLPLIESPLFPIFKSELGFTTEENRIASSLYENGYAVFDFPDEDLDARISRIKCNLEPRYGIDLDNPHSDKTIGVRRIQDAWRFDIDALQIRVCFICSASCTVDERFLSRRRFSRWVHSRNRIQIRCIILGRSDILGIHGGVDF